MLIEINDVNQIAAAQKILARNLRKELPQKRTRIIGYPSGYFESTVYFADASGQDISWWWGGPSEDGNNLTNFFGRGDPDTRATLLIDLQFNMPARSFHRRQGGAFVRDTETNELFLAHRGIVTRGKARVRKDLLLAEADVTVTPVETNSPFGQIDLLLVAPIDQRGVSDEARAFSSELRRAAAAVMEPDGGKGSKADDRDGSGQWFTVLGAYFDEFEGERTSQGKGSTTIVWKHGKIVRALKDKLVGRGSCHKSGLIDLALKTDKAIAVFEIKTSANTQSVYTGLGQLYLHGLVVKRAFPKLEVSRYLVTPSGELSSRHTSLCAELGVKLVSYKDRNGSITFSGL